ncbi:hypothetical protein EPUS_02868 [Endocarpon pusillum Z07020]|uniref:Uncharacterized protein n=1 Tax=Endocarpon pusillum (strain Z07020 / HMAS-L-300199) TaxID=1263415 RepID=U1GL34_ENDPU|nr:uncharacterized protein EPUS_02868 [Endocarpon pusillum Z07020]ERF72586.1 hypothetical protein EPUS_02868 [Endocarpon pusillum Z07020]
MHLSYCLLALSASYGALAAPRTQDHALANSGTADIFKRTMDGLPSGMCLCPCAQGQDNKQDLSKDGDKNAYGSEDYNKGTYNGGMYDGEYDQRQQEADKYIKDKYMALMKKNENNDNEKKKRRQEYALDKYSGNTVMIELVHVLVEVEIGSGKQNKHYAMSKWVVDGGKEKTKTCLMTAAETMTIGAGSCDDGAASGGAAAATGYAGDDKYQKEKEDAKMMDDKKEYDGGSGGAYSSSSYDAGAATPSYYVATSTYPDGTSTYSYTTSIYSATSSTYSDAGAYTPSPYPMASNEGEKGKDVQDKGMNDKGMNDKGMNDKGMNDKGMNDKEMKDKEMKDKGVNDKDESKKSSDSSSMSDQTKLEDGKPIYVVRRQTGGTVSQVMAPFIGMNDTIIMPASVGAPQPHPGVELVEDPAKDVGKDGWSSVCGM